MQKQTTYQFSDMNDFLRWLNDEYATRHNRAARTKTQREGLMLSSEARAFKEIFDVLGTCTIGGVTPLNAKLVEG
jgi:hypothetical protein